ncbi:MAG: hypothetical protein Q4D13_00315 [Erysipelotrichaceae bacterium]|nr:hypothetical protein [Erysipelotrichaceae bacterium]
MLDKRERYSLLLDYYGDLLTGHQVDVLTEYLNEDFSMSEIAEHNKVSKSAVQDLIKRTIRQLDDYEKCLKLIEKDSKLDIILDEMKNENNPVFDKYINKIIKIR